MRQDGLRVSPFSAVWEWRAPVEAAMFWVQALAHPWPYVSKRQRKLVLFIPGFMAGDATLAPLAAVCSWLGHRTHFAGIWSNSRCPRATLDELQRRLGRIQGRYNERVVLVGQSLGGVYARELAGRVPDQVERVITLGSPLRLLSGVNTVVTATARALGLVRGSRKGCFTESCSCGMELEERQLEVPATVVYSRSDGVVPWQSCIDRSGSRLVENIEVMASHCGMGLHPDVCRIVTDRLARWR